MAEAFTACVILTAAADHSASGGYPHYPAGMTCAAMAFAACLLGTVAVVVLHLLKLLQCLVAFQLGLVEVAFNAAAVLLYLLAVLLWRLFGYGRRDYGPYACAGCSLVDVNAVTYIVDLVLCIKSR
ncbi:uncharacterized protein ACO6RY_16405 [Pungitius sinensis]